MNESIQIIVQTQPSFFHKFLVSKETVEDASVGERNMKIRFYQTT